MHACISLKLDTTSDPQVCSFVRCLFSCGLVGLVVLIVPSFLLFLLLEQHDPRFVCEYGPEQ